MLFSHIHFQYHMCASEWLSIMLNNILLARPHYSDKMVYHYSDVIMDAIASQITSLTIVYSTVYSGADQRKHRSSASLAFVRGIHRWPVNSPRKWPVTLKMFPFDDVIMDKISQNLFQSMIHIWNGNKNYNFRNCMDHCLWQLLGWLAYLLRLWHILCKAGINWA